MPAGSHGLSPRVVTVDGPAGSGKSTLGRRIAMSLHLPFVDSGLFYRAVTVMCARRGVAADRPEQLTGTARRLDIVLDTDPRNHGPPVRVDGAPLEREELYDSRLAPLLSAVSSVAGVRQAVLEPQRRLGLSGAVAVGRDCGTVVFPEAPVKIYLNAAAEVRARRRSAQLRRRGAALEPGALEVEVGGRDLADSTRAAGPLRRAPDAHIIDTETHGIDEMVEQALALCRAAGLQPR